MGCDYIAKAKQSLFPKILMKINYYKPGVSDSGRG